MVKWPSKAIGEKMWADDEALIQISRWQREAYVNIRRRLCQMPKFTEKYNWEAGNALTGGWIINHPTLGQVWGRTKPAATARMRRLMANPATKIRVPQGAAQMNGATKHG